MTLEDPNPELTDGVVVLRSWTEDDIGCVKAASEEGEIPESTSVPGRFTVETGRDFVSRQHGRATNGEGWSLVISDAKTGEALGCITLMLRPQKDVAGIGYWLVPEARGRGYATRSVELLSMWGIESGGMERIEAWVEPGNDASASVLKRCGFEYEGRLRSFLQFPDRRTDALVFSRVRGSSTS